MEGNSGLAQCYRNRFQSCDRSILCKRAQCRAARLRRSGEAMDFNCTTFRSAMHSPESCGVPGPDHPSTRHRSGGRDRGDGHWLTFSFLTGGEAETSRLCKRPCCVECKCVCGYVTELRRSGDTYGSWAAGVGIRGHE